MSDEKAAEPKPEDRIPAHAISLPEGIHQPYLTETLLNAQLAEALSLIRDAAFLYRDSALDGHEAAISSSTPIR